MMDDTAVRSEIANFHQRLNSTDERIGYLIKLSVEASRPNYGNMIAAGVLLVTVTSGLWLLAINPVQEKISSVQASINALQANVLSKELAAQKWNEYDREMMHFQAQLKEIQERAVTKDKFNEWAVEAGKRIEREKQSR